MTIESAVLVHHLLGAQRPGKVNLRATTARDGPQIVVAWDDGPWSSLGVRLVRRQGHHPAHAADGVVVYETSRRAFVSQVADLTVRPHRWYYYTLYLWLGCEWVRLDGGDAEAWSGARAHFELAGRGTTIAEGASLATNDASLDLSLPLGERGDWLRVGATDPYDLCVLGRKGTVVTFEPVDETIATKLAGEPVQLLTSAKTRLAHIAYRYLLRSRARLGDKRINQSQALVPTALETGEVVSPRQPGVQYGLERFLRVLLAEEARLYSATFILELLCDPLRAPLSFLREAIRIHATSIPTHLRGADVRQFMLMQPAYADWIGSPTKLAKLIEIATGEPVFFRRGADRVQRFDTASRCGFGNADRLVGTIGGHVVTETGPFWSAADGVLEDLGAAFPTPDGLRGEGVRLYDRATGTPHDLPILGNDGTSLRVDAIPAGVLVPFQSKADATEWLGSASAEFILRFSPAGGGAPYPTLQRVDDIPWNPDLAGSWIVVKGATNAANNGLFRVVAVEQSDVEGDTLLLDSDAIVSEDSTRACVLGGCVPSERTIDGVVRRGCYLIDKSAPFETLSSLVGATCYPNVEDVGGPFGRPRAHRILWNNDAVLFLEGNARACWAPGVGFRVVDSYQLLLRLGTRRDRRLSLYDASDGAFNDRGLFYYVASELAPRLKTDLTEEIRGFKTVTTTVTLTADGGPTPTTQIELR